MFLLRHGCAAGVLDDILCRRQPDIKLYLVAVLIQLRTQRIEWHLKQRLQGFCHLQMSTLLGRDEYLVQAGLGPGPEANELPVPVPGAPGGFGQRLAPLRAVSSFKIAPGP